MKKNVLASLLFCCFACAARADAEADVKKTTERFYDQYREVENAGSWIAKSKDLTPEFKAAYVALLEKGINFDPILCTQDPGDGGADLKATDISVQGETASATMVLRKPGYIEPLKLSLVRRNGVWLINGINDLKGK